MKSINHVIIIPVYNDWDSLNKLLSKIDSIFKNQRFIKNKILIINDNSSKKVQLRKKNKINIIFLKENLGSQKAISIGLEYLKKIKGDFYITVMDCDGEDNPLKLKTMLIKAKRFKNSIITSNRLQREESWIVIFFYKIHLNLTFMFTLKWISFGNFSTFHKRNLQKLLSNNYSWYAHSSAVIKNCEIIRTYSKREKRYFGKSKLSFFSLVEHSLRVNSVFYKNIFFMSIFYSLVSVILLPALFESIIIASIVFFNACVCFIKYKHRITNLSDNKKYIKKIS